MYKKESGTSYDCAGQRVQTTAVGVTRTMVYDIFGQDVADYGGDALERENLYRGGQLLATQEFNTRTNVASAVNGGVATASSSTPESDGYGTFEPSSANNGDRLGLGIVSDISSNSFWRDGTNNSWPDWLQIDFNGSKLIDEVDVYSLQDNYASPSTPTSSMTFSNQGLVDFDVQYWNGSSWTTVSGGSITGNNKVWKQISFTAVTTTKIRVVVNSALNNRSRIVELEAYGTNVIGAGAINYVLQDVQGSTRALMNNDGSGTSAVIARHDYLPFGEEIGLSISPRSSGQGYGATDTNRQKYGLTERDETTGLDHTWFRKYESQSGRWTSPDPYGGSATIANPQSFNRYSYTQSDPVNAIDPTGLLAILVCVSVYNEDGGWTDNCHFIFIGGGFGGFGDPGGGGGGSGGQKPPTLETKKPKCKQSHISDRPDEQKDIESKLRAAGVSGQISNIRSAPGSPEGIMFDIANREVFVGTVKDTGKFTQDIPIDHLKQGWWQLQKHLRLQILHRQGRPWHG